MVTVFHTSSNTRDILVPEGTVTSALTVQTDYGDCCPYIVQYIAMYQTDTFLSTIRATSTPKQPPRGCSRGRSGDKLCGKRWARYGKTKMIREATTKVLRDKVAVMMMGKVVTDTNTDRTWRRENAPPPNRCWWFGRTGRSAPYRSRRRRSYDD